MTQFEGSYSDFINLSDSEKMTAAESFLGDWINNSFGHTIQIRPNPNKQEREEFPFVSRKLSKKVQRRRWLRRTVKGLGSYVLGNVKPDYCGYIFSKTYAEVKAEEAEARRLKNEANKSVLREKRQLAALKTKAKNFSPNAWLENTVPDGKIEKKENPSQIKPSKTFSFSEWAND